MCWTRRYHSMSRGFLWFAQNNDTTDYAALSIALAKSIKTHCKINSVCVVVDEHTKIQSEHVDTVIVLKQDHSKNQSSKFANEHKAFKLSPFTHTIKLEADMLFTANTDWWWNHLCQHDLVFAVNCRNYQDHVVKKTPYRKLFHQNNLPDVYNGLTYFRRSERAMQFFKLCKDITENWTQVKNELLINCHEQYPSTDIVYALAYRIMDPLQLHVIDYSWFKFIHGKPEINGVENAVDQYNYLNPIQMDDRIYVGGRRLNRIWHYHDKKMIDILNDRVF